jgi:hypothetical protein
MAMLMRALRGGGDAQGRFDANHCRDARRLKLPARVAEEGLHCGKVQPVAYLVRARDGEVLAGSGENIPAFELILQRLALGFMSL